MATKKRDETKTRTPGDTEEYDKALAEFSKGVESLRRSDFAAARDSFVSVGKLISDEPELVERAQMYTQVCDRRLEEPQAPPTTAEEKLHRSVFLTNDGRLDEAISILDEVLRENPTSIDHLYVRASAWAIKGVADRAVADLRQAILVDPTIRYQAVNDPDFERVREEPSFIDIIEPTPTGA